MYDNAKLAKICTVSYFTVLWCCCYIILSTVLYYSTTELYCQLSVHYTVVHYSTVKEYGVQYCSRDE